jgi:hypothetical protein
MDRRLGEFARGERAIGSTISDLKGLFWALEQTPPDGEWGSQFLERWGELEVRHAAALDRNERMPDALDPAIRNVVDRMTELIRGRMVAFGSN